MPAPRPVLFAMLALFASPALARPPGPPGPPPPPDVILADHADQLGIDAATIAEAKRIAQDARPELDRLHQEARAAHEAIRDKHREVMEEVMDLLTEEQRTQLEALLPPPPRHPPGPPGPPRR